MMITKLPLTVSFLNVQSKQFESYLFTLGHTDLAFTEDVHKRFEAYGWHVVDVADGEPSLHCH